MKGPLMGLSLFIVWEREKTVNLKEKKRCLVLESGVGKVLKMLMPGQSFLYVQINFFSEGPHMAG